MLSPLLDARSDESFDDSLGDELAEGEGVGGAVDESEAFRLSRGVNPDGVTNVKFFWRKIRSDIRQGIQVGGGQRLGACSSIPI